VSLALSALTIALGSVSSAYSWLAWIGLVPLLLAIRLQDPIAAILSGGIWGIWLLLFSCTSSVAPIKPTIPSLILLATVPAVFTGAGWLLTRAVGFNPFLLAALWIGVEIAVKPLGLHHGLLAGTQGQDPYLVWISHVLGCSFVAFLLVCANAAILVVLVNTQLAFTRSEKCKSPNQRQHSYRYQATHYAARTALDGFQPRAPPSWPRQAIR
jgi:apolipoprotein N-acyltransferase